MLIGIIHHLIDSILIYLVLSILVFLHWPTHAAIAQQRDLSTVLWRRASLHFSLSGLPLAFIFIPGNTSCDRKRSDGSHTGSGSLQKISSVHNLVFSMHHKSVYMNRAVRP